MTRTTFLLVAAQLAACGIVSWACGSLVRSYIEPRLERTLGLPERALLAAFSFFALSVALMVGQIVSAGAVFAIPGLVPAIAVALVIRAVGRNGLPRPRIGRRHVGAAALACVLLVVFATPLVASGSSVRAGDPPWHLGWTEQLLAGEPVPTGPAPEFGRNAYPWGFHGLLATMVRLVPGSDPLSALETMHVLLIGLIPLAAACLARMVNPRAGLAAAWSAGLVGGFGWVRAGISAFDASPSEARFGADLVAASPNSMYELFPPALPREVALVGLAVAAVLLAHAIRTGDRRLQFIAGAAMGAVGLISVPMMLNAIAWSLAMCLIVIKRDRVRTTGAIIGGAVVVFALWAGPVVSDYLRFDGFVNITPQLGVEWSLGTALASWGLLLPLAIAGVGVLLAQPRVVSRPLLACLAGSATLLVLALARARFNWGLFGNETLLHQGRIWPPLHLLGAATAGVALVAGYAWLRRHGRVFANATVAGVVAIGAASPVVAARGLTEISSEHRKGFDYSEPDQARGSFVRRAAEHLGPNDIVEVEGSNELAFLLFQFSGTTLATYNDPRLIGNELRIRFSDLADSWDRTYLNEGFEPDYIVRPVVGLIRPGRALEYGLFRNDIWELVPADG